MSQFSMLSDCVHSTKQENRQKQENRTTNIEENEGVRVLHPLSIAADMFDKTFQMLDVLFKSEVPTLV